MLAENLAAVLLLLVVTAAITWVVAEPPTRAAGQETLLALAAVPPVIWMLVTLALITLDTWPRTVPLDVIHTGSPLEALRMDRRAFLLSRLAGTTQVMVLLWAVCGWTAAGLLLAHAVLSVTAQLLIGAPPVLDQVRAGQGYADARFWLAITGRLPWRTMAFLSEAHRLGVLRQAGAVYQFRHLSLQENLAGQHGPRRPRYSVAGVGRRRENPPR
jgi:hypothetical protein